MQSWKSTATGLFTAFFAFVYFSPETFAAWPWLIALAKFAVIGGLAAQGVLSKDFNVSGKPPENKP